MALLLIPKTKTAADQQDEDFESEAENVFWSDEEEIEEEEEEEAKGEDVYQHQHQQNGGSNKKGRRHSNRSQSESENNENDDLLIAMRIPLLIGACWGLLPLTNFTEKHAQFQNLSWFKVRTLIALSIITLIGCNTLFMGIDFALSFSNSHLTSIGKVAEKASGVFFYAAGLLVYLFCLIRSPKTCTYFNRWRAMCRGIKAEMKGHDKLVRDMNIICFTVLISCAGENILFHAYAMRSGLLLLIKGRPVTLWDFLEDYYESNQYIKQFFNYSPIISALLLLTNKCALFAWNFGDVILMMFSRAVYARFRALNHFLEERMDFGAVIPLIRQGSVDWSEFRKTFFIAVTLLEEADKLLYPLIWVSYSTNMFFVCNQLYLGIRQTEIRTPVHRAYVTWSFIHLALRTLAVNIFAARIHEYAHKISRSLQFCPHMDYSPEVRRLERYLGGHIIGITGNGVFMVTRSYILMIISAIFTLEVFILQNSPS